MKRCEVGARGGREYTCERKGRKGRTCRERGEAHLYGGAYCSEGEATEGGEVPREQPLTGAGVDDAAIVLLDLLRDGPLCRLELVGAFVPDLCHVLVKLGGVEL